MEKLGKKLKHDHTLTNILKFAIFSVIMLAPIFSVASRCLYVICNKNAKDSYSGTSSYDINYKYSNGTLDNLNVNDLYQFSFDYDRFVHDNVHLSQYYYFELVQFNQLNCTIDDAYIDESMFAQDDVINDLTYLGFEFDINGDNVYYLTLTITYPNGNDAFTSIVYSLSDYNIVFIGKFVEIYSDLLREGYMTTTTYNEIESVTISNEGKLDNAFEYSLSQLENNNYYNWATNLGIYTPINNMVSGLGGHSIISLLLAYWSIYTAIYIVFDIIIACFVKLTHLLQSE